MGYIGFTIANSKDQRTTISETKLFCISREYVHFSKENPAISVFQAHIAKHISTKWQCYPKERKQVPVFANFKVEDYITRAACRKTFVPGAVDGKKHTC
jgi:hypothetical protein